MDAAYHSATFRLSELDHAYGPGVHLLGDPFALTLLARLCSPKTTQPAFNQLIRRLYRHLLTAVINQEFPRERVRVPTRMASEYPQAVLEGEFIDPTTRVVCVDIARAGILPSQVCYDLCNEVFEPEFVRQDHVVMSRVTGDDDEVTGAEISGGKIGGGIDGRFVLFPDPMGATGSSLATAITHYKAEHGSNPARIITMNLIVTPQFIRTMQDVHPDVVLYALRVDRGMSGADVLSTGLGERWDDEDGLTDKHYIVPGGGGFGELMNNSWV